MRAATLARGGLVGGAGPEEGGSGEERRRQVAGGGVSGCGGSRGDVMNLGSSVAVLMVAVVVEKRREKRADVGSPRSGAGGVQPSTRVSS